MNGAQSGQEKLRLPCPLQLHNRPTSQEGDDSCTLCRPGPLTGNRLLPENRNGSVGGDDIDRFGSFVLGAIGQDVGTRGEDWMIGKLFSRLSRQAVADTQVVSAKKSWRCSSGIRVGARLWFHVRALFHKSLQQI